MRDLFEVIFDSDTNRETEYKITFSADGNVTFLEVSTCSAKPRLWKQLPTQISADLAGFDDAQAEAVEHFNLLDAEDEAAHIAWDNARIVNGVN